MVDMAIKKMPQEKDKELKTLIYTNSKKIAQPLKVKVNKNSNFIIKQPDFKMTEKLKAMKNTRKTKIKTIMRQSQKEFQQGQIPTFTNRKNKSNEHSTEDDGRPNKLSKVILSFSNILENRKFSDSSEKIIFKSPNIKNSKRNMSFQKKLEIFKQKMETTKNKFKNKIKNKKNSHDGSVLVHSSQNKIIQKNKIQNKNLKFYKIVHSNENLNNYDKHKIDNETHHTEKEFENIYRKPRISGIFLIYRANKFEIIYSY